jgi:hypothetical protein
MKLGYEAAADWAELKNVRHSRLFKNLLVFSDMAGSVMLTART